MPERNIPVELVAMEGRYPCLVSIPCLVTERVDWSKLTHSKTIYEKLCNFADFLTTQAKQLYLVNLINKEANTCRYTRNA